MTKYSSLWLNLGQKTPRFLRWIAISMPLLGLSFNVSAVKVSEMQLDNGMKVLVKVDKRAPIIMSQIWYKVGSVDEHSGSTGLSHILEHMMFKGTKKHPDDSFSKIISKLGGQQNAFTSRDYTAYYQSVGSEHLETSLALEADRMRNVIFNQSALKKERDVVAEERRLRVDDKPLNLLHEQFYTTAFPQNPYRNPIIGSMSDIENTQIADLRDWYDRYYAPNNAVLVVVGDVSPNGVLSLAKKYFGSIKPNNKTRPKIAKSLPQKKLKRLTEKTTAQVNYLIMGFKVPSLKSIGQDKTDAYALDILAEILSGDDSSRLSKNIIRAQKLATNSGSYYNLLARNDTLFVIDGILAQNQTLEKLESGLLAQLALLKTEAVTKEELERVKIRVVADHVYKADSLFSQAYEIGLLEASGLGWETSENYLTNLSKVSQADLMRVAKKYFKPHNLTVATLAHDPKL